MSYILNALRKSELERKQGQTDSEVILANIISQPSAPIRSKLPGWVMLFMAVNMAVLAYLLLHTFKQPEAIVALPLEIKPVAETTPSMKTQDKAQDDHVLHVENAILSAAKIPDVGHKKIELAFAEAKSKPEISNAKPKDIKKPNTDKTKEKKQADTDIELQKIKAGQEKTVKPKLEPQVVKRQNIIADDIEDSSPELVTPPVSSVREYKAPIPDPNHYIPLLSQLPADMHAQIPKFIINVFAYAENAKDRFLIINMSKYKIGDTIQQSIVLQNILPEGAIFVYNNQRFRLERP